MKRARRLLTLMLFAAAMQGSVGAREFDEPKILSKKQKAIVDAAPLGSEANPVRCEEPEGESTYLGRLRCPSGGPPTFERRGSVGQGPYGTVLDRYEVTCPEWPEPVDVYMDMYHKNFTENRPVPKFSVTAAK